MHLIAKSRIAAIRLAEKIEKNKAYAEKVGVSVEMKKLKKEKLIATNNNKILSKSKGE